MKSLIHISISPGEIVQVLGWAPGRYTLRLPGRTRTKTAYIALGQGLRNSRSLPVNPEDTVAQLLERWLADAPVLSIAQTAQAFGLEAEQATRLEAAGDELIFRLNTLLALLEGRPAIAFDGENSIAELTDFLIGVREFCTQSHLPAGPDPAFAVLGEGPSFGVSMIADRILAAENGEVRELYLEL